MTVEKHPEFFCCYNNEKDQRSCICWGYDRACCYKPTCSPNLATTGGKIILGVYIMVLLFLIIAPILNIKF